MPNNKRRSSKGDFIMLAVHSKAPFVVKLEQKQEFEKQMDKCRSKFLEMMKEMESESNRGVDLSGNKK